MKMLRAVGDGGSQNLSARAGRAKRQVRYTDDDDDAYLRVQLPEKESARAFRALVGYHMLWSSRVALQFYDPACDLYFELDPQASPDREKGPCLSIGTTLERGFVAAIVPVSSILALGLTDGKVPVNWD